MKLSESGEIGLPPAVRKRTIIRTVESGGALISMGKSHLKLVAPATENRTVMPRRLPNAELRSREYLTDREVELLTEAAKELADL